MAAERGGAETMRRRGGRELCRGARLAQAAGLGMVALQQDAVGGDLRMADRLAPGQHRRAGHACRLEARDPLGRGALAQHALGQFQTGVLVPVQALRVLKARIFQPFWPLGRLRQAAPLLVAHHGHGDVAVLGLVDQVDPALRHLAVQFVADEGVATHVGAPEKGQHGIQHGKAHVLALSRAAARQQRGADRLGHGEAGQLVRQDGAHQARPLRVGPGLHGGQAAQRLDQRVENRLVGEGALEAEAGDGDVNQARVDLPQGVVAQTEAVGDAGAEVLQEDVGIANQALHRLQPLRGLEIEGDGALVAVVVEERGGEAVTPGRHLAGVIAAPGHFHLDHVGALVGQDHAAQRPGDHGGQIDDPEAL